MPYESPNIVIVPTVSAIVHKKGQFGQKPSTQCYKNKASTVTPVIENSAKPLPTQVTKMSSQKPSSGTQNEIINEISKGVANTTSQGNTSNPALITDGCVNKNSTNMQDSKGIGTPCANSSKYLQNIEQCTKPATTVTDAIELNVLSTSNYIKQNVDSKGNKKSDQQIKPNLSRSKVMKTSRPMLPPENFRPYVDTKTWTGPPVPQTSADQSSIPPIYQQDIADPYAGFRPRLDTKTWLTQQYHANHVHSQNENMNSNNENSAMIQGNSFTHYYTPSYKSPMDYTWLTHEYYTNLSSYYQPNTYPNKHNENTVGIKLNNSIKQNVIKPSSDRKSLSPNDNKIVKSTYKETLSKREILEKNYKKKSNNLQDLKELNKQSQGIYRNNKIEEPTGSKTNAYEKQRRKSLDSKIKQSDRDKMSIKTCNLFTSSKECREGCKVKESSKVKEVSNNRKTKEYVEDKNKKHIHKKRKHDQIYETSAHNEENRISKIRKLTHSLAPSDKETPRKSNKQLDTCSKDEIKNRSRHVDTHSVPQRKRIHSGSSSESQPRKRFRSTEKVDHNDSCEKITPVKSVVIFSNNPELRHPRIQAPETVSCRLDSNKDIETHFDLRSKLNRKEQNKMYYKSQDSEKATGEKNLLVTVNRSEDDSVLPKPGPSKLNQKTKKYKKYQLVINVICKNQEDSSYSSSSDENESKNAIHSPNAVSADETELKPDLSFLDDINIDEIVSSLNIIEDTKIPVTNIKKKLQPTFVESEIRSELIQPEVPDKQSNCENSQYMSYDSDDTVNLGSPNSNIHEQNTGVIAPEINKITNQDFIVTVKKEKHVDEPKNIFCKQDTKISYNQLENSALNKNVNEFANNLIDKVIENMQTHTDVQSSVEILKNIKSEPCDSYDNNNENEALELIVTDKEIKLEKCIETVPISSIDKLHPWCNNVNQENETQDLITAEKKNDLHKLNEILESAIIDNESSRFHNPCKLLVDSDKTESSNVADFTDLNKAENSNVTNCADKITKLNETLNDVEPRLIDDNEIISENEIPTDNNAGSETNIIVHPLPKSDKTSYKTESPNVADISELNKAENNNVTNCADKITKLNETSNDVEPRETDVNEIISENEIPTDNAGTETNIIVHPLPKSDNVMKPRIEDKTEDDSLVKCDVKAEDKIEDLPKMNEDSNNSNIKIICDTIVQPSHNSAVLELKINEKSTEIKPAITETAIRDQKEEIKTDANMHPSLKSHKDVVFKIQERVLEYLKLNVKVLSLVRDGKFSKIFKCEDRDNHYALKFIKDKQSYHSRGIKKEDMLCNLQEDIPKENLNTVYLINGLGVDRNWCFLMDYYPNNLRVVIMQTKFDIATVQDLARQLVSAVMVMRTKNIVHSDIKPLHILLDSTNKRLKVCGFDEAYYADDNKEVLPNIGTAVYRAPEIILGYSAGFSIDVWATALVIYEMVAGTKLFKGFGFNNAMLFNQMCMFGYLPADMVLNSRFAYSHFSGSVFKKIVGSCGQYVLYSMDNFNNRMQMYDVLMPISNRVCKSSNFQNQLEDMAKLARLLDKMLVLDPRRRIPIEFVYTDPFFMYRNAEVANFRYF